MKNHRQEAPTKSNQETNCIENKQQQHKYARCSNVNKQQQQTTAWQKKGKQTYANMLYPELKGKHDTMGRINANHFAKKGR